MWMVFELSSWNIFYFDIALQNSIQSVFKSTTIIAPIIMDEDVVRKPKKTKSKPKTSILLLHVSDDDVLIQSSFNNLIITGLSSSNLKVMYSASKRLNKSFFYPRYASQTKRHDKYFGSFTCKSYIFIFNLEWFFCKNYQR